MGMISIEKRGKVALVRLDRSVTNAINMECVKALSVIIESLRSDPEVEGVNERVSLSCQDVLVVVDSPSLSAY